MPRHHSVRIRVPEAQEELLAAWLWAVGCEGFVSEPAAEGELLVEATFSAANRPARGELASLVAWVPGAGVVDSGAVEERDWLETWRRSAVPIPLGERLLVDPREWDEVAEAPDPALIGDRLVLRIPARTAFGTGSHESTRLAYELLERTALGARRVLDVGCGSGILAMAALLLGARAAIGFDLDPGAAFLASQYARANRNAAVFFAGRVAALAADTAFDVVIANALPHELADEMAAIVGAVRPGGTLILSGILLGQANEVREGVFRLGVEEFGDAVAGDWTALGFTKPEGVVEPRAPAWPPLP